MTEASPSVSTRENEKYAFEDETKLYEIDSQSEKGREFARLSTGPEKIGFLKENGQETTKETGGRVMLPNKGAWRFYNVCQLEYMFRADDDDSSESSLEKQCKEIEGVDKKKGFFLKNATRIREWPERIQRMENLG